jgi:hypothetical protein
MNFFLYFSTAPHAIIKIENQMKQKTYYFILVLILFASSNIFAVQQNIKTYEINNIIQKSWGALKTVYDQPNNQRLTFESKEQITLVEIGLNWNAYEKAYVPHIKQIIKLPKTDTPAVLPTEIITSNNISN